MQLIDSFLPSVLFLYLQKALENCNVFNFKGYEYAVLENNGLFNVFIYNFEKVFDRWILCSPS